MAEGVSVGRLGTADPAPQHVKGLAAARAAVEADGPARRQAPSGQPQEGNRRTTAEYSARCAGGMMATFFYFSDFFRLFPKP